MGRTLFQLNVMQDLCLDVMMIVVDLILVIYVLGEMRLIQWFVRIDVLMHCLLLEMVGLVMRLSVFIFVEMEK